MKKLDETEIIGKTVIERLPELSEVDANNAVGHTNLAWAHGFMKNHVDGQTHFTKSVGMHLQKVNDSIVRCIAIVDHPYCFDGLAMAKISFEKAGIEFQIDPFTVIIPYEPMEMEEVVDEPGLEVI
tara:strand:+ start:218 stop:595 length:378 start_codon:yes stop_codon:yes gene_type:complete